MEQKKSAPTKVGDVVGNITILEYIGQSKNYVKLWKCRCNCGHIFVTRQDILRRPSTRFCKTCGLGWRRKHGLSKGGAYTSYMAMMHRCYNKKSDNYVYYGGLGVTVCERWRESFENFYADMGDRPRGTSLDRKNPFGNYEPSNCKWSTVVEQANNTRRKNKKDKTIGLSVHNKHVLLELEHCDANLLNNESFIEQVLKDAAAKANATIISSFSHKFEPQGVTAAVILSESHITLHSWPERDFASADIFTCGEHVNPLEAAKLIAESVKSKRVKLILLTRSPDLDNPVAEVKKFTL